MDGTGHASAGWGRIVGGDGRLGEIVAPRPCVTEPQGGEEVEGRRVGPPVVSGDEHDDVLGPGLRVFDGHVEVAVVIEDRNPAAVLA